MSTPRLLPEQEARVLIDELLEAAGWVVQDYQDADIAAAEGVAVREFPTVRGPVDYLLFASAKAVGSVEAKPAGRTLRSVESQAERYADGFEESVKGKAYPATPIGCPSTTSRPASKPCSRAAAIPFTDRARSSTSIAPRRSRRGRRRSIRCARGYASSRP